MGTWQFGKTAALLVVLAAITHAHAGPEAKTQAWPRDRGGFAAFTAAVEAQHPRNLLARQGVQVHVKDLSGEGMLTDGDAGENAGEGRVNVGGAPSVVTYYLGGPKPIHRVGVFTCNGDSRSNQRYEVYLADHSARPGEMPKFGDTPAFTTGEKILGRDGGAFYSYFATPEDTPVVPRKADWVQFRIWRTYPSTAGQPVKSAFATGWSAVVELQALGDPKDAQPIPPEVKRSQQQLRELTRQAAKEPAIERKATWQETMVAAREAILRWESALDARVAEALGVTLGPWQALEPLAADDPALRQVERLRNIDTAQPLVVEVKGKPKRTLSWRPCPNVADGEMADLAKVLGAKPGQVVVLCRALSLPAGLRKIGDFAFGAGLDAGALSVPGRSSSLKLTAASGGAVPNQASWSLREGPGDHQLLAVLPVGEDGRCRLWFMPQALSSRPGAGEANRRVDRRRQVLSRLEGMFEDPASRRQIAWEREDCIWNPVVKGAMARRDHQMNDWAPGEEPAFLVGQYNAHAGLRAEAVGKELATAPAGIRPRIAAWLGAFGAADPPRTVRDARKRYYSVATVQQALAEGRRIESLRLAVEDQQRTFGEKYPRGPEHLRRVEALEKRMAAVWDGVLAGREGGPADPAALGEAIAAEGKAILLDNPLLTGMGKLLLGRGGPGFASNWGGANRIGNEIVVLSPVRPDGEITTVYQGAQINDMDLSFDAKKVLFSAGNHLHEIHVDGTGYRQITRQTDEHVKHYDACRLPDGKILFVSTACEQAVPCTGGWYVGNLHVINPDGTGERRLTYDQDHNWNPRVLNSGQVIYARWEYTDTPHYFSRLLFTMNPDGTAQMEYYGSNSYWPNAMYWPQPIPGEPTRVVCIVSGHHGVSRVGQMVILDTAKGRHEADGVVQRIGERGRKVEPVILDGLVKDWWPRFAYPYPLAEPGTNRGAGTYFLANCQKDEWSPWTVCLVDIFDNITPLLGSGYCSPIPLLARPRPPVIPPRVDLRRNDALVYMSDATRGGGLRGYPRGSVKALRIGSHVYRFGGNGDTRASSFEGGWDVKRILGTVPVEADGSAYFRVPANTPIFVQPLDEEGKALQTMRSWFTAMPGEVLSCVGCHERQSHTPGVTQTIASARPPSEIAPWFGPTRGFSFDREVQPVLDRRCAGCHDGTRPGHPDFRAKRLHEGYAGNYSPAYLALAPYVRRAGYEADYHLPAPSEWQADTSPVVQLLKKGHHNVRLTTDEWRRLYAWIDFNVPYAGNWSESHRPPAEDQVARRAKYKKLYANVADHDERPLSGVPVDKFQPPAPEPPAPAPLKLAGWPLKTNEAIELQRKLGREEMTVDLGEGVTMAFVPVPAGRFVMGDANAPPDERPQAVAAIDRPFHLGRLEVTNRQYARFDPSHDSAYMDARGKDRFTRGYPVNEPDQPVVRVSWHEAMAFCRWLSEKTGAECTLPTETEWEWACRAGTDTPWSFAPTAEGAANVGNVADNTLSGWAWGRVERGYSDGARFSVAGGKYKPNAWGLHDMIGNVAEWTLSDCRPYPYAADGRNGPPDRAAAGPTPKVVRGGSWYDTFGFCRSGWRWRYPPHQPVFNVGFRVLCRPASVAGR